MGWTNFAREALGYKDGFIATCIVEIYEESDTDKHDIRRVRLHDRDKVRG